MPTGQADRLMPTLRRVVLARQSAARSDGDLLGAFVTARDAEAFAELVRRHGPMVLGVCRRVVGDPTAADDAFQAAFIVLARRAATVRPREQVGNYLYGVAYRTALKARTVLARRRTREKQVDVMPEPTAPPAGTEWTDLLPVIDEELARLPVKLRVPVVLCDLEGRTQREVAKHLNVPPATLATRLAAARRTLAARLTRRGVTLSGGALAGLLGAHASASVVPPALSGGAARAAEAVATGASVQSLVSANAVQLSEGVMRMMMIAKLKTVAVTAVTVLALTTGLGLGLVPAAAGDRIAHEEGSGAAPAAKSQPTAPGGATARLKAAPEPEIDDATFLRRLCLDVRGTLPTAVETWFFISDGDDDKRAKVVEWMTDDDAARAHLAKKLGVPIERVKVFRVRPTLDGNRLAVVADGREPGPDVLLTFTADGKKPAVLADGTVRPDAAVWGQLEHKNTAGTLAAWIDAGEDPKTTAFNRYTWRRIAALDKNTGKVLSGTAPMTFKTVDLDADGALDTLWLNEVNVDFVPADSDAEFLKRVLTDARGSGPTALELKYFTEDKDPKKREKLLDTLLKDAAVQKKLGDSWKAKMLALKTADKAAKYDRLFLYAIEPDTKGHLELFLRDATQPGELLVKPLPPQPPVPPAPPVPPRPPVPPAPMVVKPFNPPAPSPAPQADKFEKLVGELIAAKKSDEAILEALTLATLSRLPTDSEKRLALAGVGNTADRKAAWVAVAKALAGPGTAKGPSALNIEIVVDPTGRPKPPAPPVPPARP